MSHPTLIILAGGASSRMWPLREKSLLRFGAHPLLIEQLRRYQGLGFTEAVLVGNPENADILRGLVSELDGLTIQVVIQPEPKGMGDALLKAAMALPLDQHPAIYITQVHDVTDLSLHESVLVAYHDNPSASYLAGVEREDYFPGGYLVVDYQDIITGIIEKPGANHRPSNLVNLVAHVHSDAGRLLDEISRQYMLAATPDDHYERAMDVLMK
jgi:NDP-sugar pyrophosphorylase family protein